MKNSHKTIKVINKFPWNLNRIHRMLELDSIDLILDTTRYFKPAALLEVTQPNLLILNRKLSASNALEMMGNIMQQNGEIKLGLLTNDVSTLRLSIQKNFDTSFFIEAYRPGKIISKKLPEAQLN